jgi:4-hydroxybutyryl-CoA dehydratase/vinylacetyl-CoA-Delta-isomerase
MELLTGAAAAAAEANGVANAAHIRNKLIDMTIHSQTVWGLALAAAHMGKPAPSGSGIVLPDSLTINVGKYRSVEGYWECCKLANDIAGGMATCVPSFKDYDNPETHHWMEKYFVANPAIPTEHRMRIMRLIQCMALSPIAGGIHQSGGPMENQKIIIGRDGEFEKKMHDAKVLCGILPEED